MPRMRAMGTSSYRLPNTVIAVIMAAFFLSACGGGGGGGGNGGSTPTSPPVTSPVPPGPVSMVPAAPATGAVLYADATQLRPLVDGAVWTYRGTVTRPGAVAPKIYTNVVKQVAAPQGGMIESVSNLFDAGEDSGRVFMSAGSVKLTQSLKFTPTQPVALEATDTELHSPVLQNHQYTVFDQHNINSGSDADHDGKTDLMDVAIYRTVVGNETVNLPNMPAVTALRVDITNLLRVTFSSNGQYSDVVKVVQSSWYAPGIGLVRQRMVAPSANGADEVTDEVLVSWDGVSKGLGVMPAQILTVPVGTPYFSGFPVPNVIDTVTFAEHGVASIGTPWTAGSGPTRSGFHFALIDQRGKVSKVQSYLDIPDYLDFSMLKTADGFAEISPTRIYLFDKQAGLLTAADGIAYNAAASTFFHTQIQRYVVADDGDGFLMLMHRSYLDASFRTAGHIVLRKYTYQGQQVGEELILSHTDGRAPIWPYISVNNGQMIATWSDDKSFSYAVRSSPQAMPVVRQDSNLLRYGALTPLALKQPGKYALYGTNSTFPYAQVGVLVDNDLSLLFAAGNTDLSKELLLETAGISFGLRRTAISASDTGIVQLSTILSKLYPESTEGRLYVLADYPASALPWSQQTPSLIRFRPDFFISDATEVKQLVFADRVIAIVSEPTTVRTAVIWRR